MKEKLTIKNFGPIKDVELEIKQFSVLIGEQATGKSTIAKLLAVCRYFSYIIGDDNLPVDESPFLEGLHAWGLDEAFQKETLITYECEHYSLNIEYRPGQSFFNGRGNEQGFIKKELRPISLEFIDLMLELDKIRPNPMDLMNLPYGWTIPTSFFQNDVARVMHNPFYLSTERGLQSIFSIGKTSIQNISDSLFILLAKIDRIAKTFKDDTTIEPLGILYRNTEGKAQVRKQSDNTFYDLSKAASGYKSTIPIVLATKHYVEFRKRIKTFIIEEPELDLFPNAQQKLIQYLVERNINNGNSLFIETHSPYILASLNNLMYAFNVGKIDFNGTSEIVDSKYWLDSEQVSAYILHPNGTCESIIDLESNLIKAEKIDEVSRLLNSQFDRLLNIEFGGNNEPD